MWAVRKLWRDKPHVHEHGHDASGHAHEHTHQGEHVHVHDMSKKATTAWALFVIFVFGPCEPLIPILMYPAAKNSWTDLIAVTATFGFVTLATMIGMVFLCRAGVNLTVFKKLHKFGHIIGGIAILLCGLAVAVLGL
jgi:sulfite exporter TauE/SafE